MCWFQGGSDLPGAVASAGVVTTEAIVCLAAHKARAWPPPREDCTRTVLSARSTHRSRHVEAYSSHPLSSSQMIVRCWAAVPELGVLSGVGVSSFSCGSGNHGPNHRRDSGAAYPCLRRGRRSNMEPLAKRRAKLPLSRGGDVPG